MKPIISWIMRAGASLRAGASGLWKWFKARKRWQQVLIVAVLAIVLIGVVVIARSGGTAAVESQLRAVTVESVANLSGTGNSVSVIGTVRSVAEADLLAQAGGTVRAVHAQIGSVVPAGFIIAELDNATERAQVLQAQGAYDAAVASRNAVSPTDATAAARNAYRSAITTLDTVLHNDIDTVYGGATPVGPRFLLNEGRVPIDQISRRRAEIEKTIIARRRALPNADSRDPEALLMEAQSDLSTVATLLEDITEAANRTDSNVTTVQTAALTAARTSLNAQISAITSARETYRSKSTSSTASVDAGVKSALGSLRLAQASLEKSYVRAPIGGTVNFLPIRIGDYVTMLQHVATVANNGTLEIVTHVSENDRENISAGMKVKVEDTYDGVITTIAPALDPTNKQIEVHVTVSGDTALVNGQSVRIAFPDAIAAKPTAQDQLPAGPVGPLLLPLAAVKLNANTRIVFTVGEDSRLVAHQVQIGEVRGDRIEITSGITPDLMIVTDARGLADGQKVQVTL